MEVNYGCYASEWFLISETKGDLKCRTIGGIFLLFIQLGIYKIRKKIGEQDKSQFIVYIYIVRETYCLSACMSVVQPVLSTV